MIMEEKRYQQSEWDRQREGERLKNFYEQTHAAEKCMKKNSVSENERKTISLCLLYIQGLLVFISAAMASFLYSVCCLVWTCESVYGCACIWEKFFNFMVFIVFLFLFFFVCFCTWTPISAVIISMAYIMDVDI